VSGTDDGVALAIAHVCVTFLLLIAGLCTRTAAPEKALTCRRSTEYT